MVPTGSPKTVTFRIIIKDTLKLGTSGNYVGQHGDLFHVSMADADQ